MSALNSAIKLLINYAYPWLDGTPLQDGQAFPTSYPLKPYYQARHIGWTHYGVMIPDLPAPHQFFSIMSVIGTPGALAFDVDHALKDTPRQNATAFMGTAATHPQQFQGYAIARDCQFSEDGSHIQFGNTIIMTGQYPDYHVLAREQNFELDIQITNTDKVSWFVKTPVYDHLSLLSTYQGTVSHQGKTQHITGLCTFEYAACISPYLLRDKPIAPHFKVPLDFFTYQIINLDDHTQLLLNDTRLNNVKIVSKAFLRSLNQYNHSYAAEFEVLSYQEQPAIAPDGVPMRLPQSFRWRIRDTQGHTIFIINGTVDTPFTYGLGTGYVGAYHYEGTYQDKIIQGRGYIEYIDRRHDNSRNNRTKK